MILPGFPDAAPLAGLVGGVLIGVASMVMLLGVAAIARTIPPDTITEGPILATALTLVARAAIIPSRGTRTLVLGLLATVIVSIGYALRSGDRESLVGFASIWTLAFTAASSLVSRVIYGLQKNVREARRLGQYVLEQKLGEGGMGTVYRARHALLRRPTAIKLLAPDRAGADNVARFEREVRQTARLSHPNTVTIYDYGRTPDGVFYYAMELLEGADLGEIVELGGAMPTARVVHVIASVAGALSEAHGVGLIHRDIKPANIVLCQQGGMPDVAKVVDFGLVKELGEAGMTEAGSLTGTPLYMAPEAITAPESVDGRSDLYALGAVTYYLLTGRHVFEGKSVMEVCAQHLTQDPDPPSLHASNPIPEALERLVLECLEKDPAKRPPTALAVIERLFALEGVQGWTPHEARDWWNTHGPSLLARRDGPANELGKTLAVDLEGRRSEISA